MSPSSWAEWVEIFIMPNGKVVTATSPSSWAEWVEICAALLSKVSWSLVSVLVGGVG